MSRVPASYLVKALLLVLGPVITVAEQPSEQESLDEIRRFEEWQEQQEERFQPDPDVFIESPMLPLGDEPKSEDVCFPIEQVVLESAERKRFEWLERNLNDLLEGGNCLSAQAINRMMTQAQNQVIERGYVTTRVVAEEQELKTGMLSLTVLPGYVAEIRFVEGVPRRATYWNALPMVPGDVINLRHIEQALENFQRVPSVQVNIDIEPAERPGYSNLVIQWSQEKPLRVTESFDNSGSESTGQYQSSVTLSYDPYWALNDLFYVTFSQAVVFDWDDKGTQSINAHYSIPYGYWLLSLGAGGSEHFQTITGAVEDYEYGGDSSNQSLGLERLVYRNNHGKTTVSAKLTARQSKSYINDVEIRVQRRQSSTLALSVDHETVLAQANVNMGTTYELGLMAFDAIAERAVEDGDVPENQQTLAVNLGYKRPFQAFGGIMTLDSSLSAQQRLTPLTSRNHFSIGGRYSVRGFEGASLSGETGAYVRNELSYGFSGTPHQIFVGLDAGLVDMESDGGQVLAGTAVGVRGAFWGVSYDTFASAPLFYPSELDPSDAVYGFQISKTF